MKKSIALVFVTSTLLLAGCGKASHVTEAGDSANVTNWGVVELSVNTPKHLILGEGKDCTLTATSPAGGSMQIVIKTDEKLENGVPVVSTYTWPFPPPPGGEVSGYIAHKLVRFTPILKSP